MSRYSLPSVKKLEITTWSDCCMTWRDVVASKRIFVSFFEIFKSVLFQKEFNSLYNRMQISRYITWFLSLLSDSIKFNLYTPPLPRAITICKWGRTLSTRWCSNYFPCKVLPLTFRLFELICWPAVVPEGGGGGGGGVPEEEGGTLMNFFLRRFLLLFSGRWEEVGIFS